MKVEWVARRAVLPLDSASVSHARRFLRESIRAATAEWGAQLLDDAVLLTSEVVTNALLHSGTPVELSVHCGYDRLRVEVADGSSSYPVRRDHPPLAGTGRGLRLLDELATRWGIDPTEDGKVVWFELAPTMVSTTRTTSTTSTTSATSRTQRLQAPASSDPDGSNDAGTMVVVLLNVPLLLHAAWQIHAETVLREHMLATLTIDGACEQLETHAAAHAALTLLLDHVPQPDLGDAPDELMAVATEPHVSLERLTLRLAAEAVHEFARLDWALSQAWDMARAGELLTPPMQPELWMFRQWLCREVAQQCRGDAPRPWSLDSTALMPPQRPHTQWDTQDVTGSRGAFVAADDTNALVAISPAAVALLGYQSADQLLGKRLVSIIPTRFHQAHIAGFSMHLSMDRSPLLGRAVGVPALRCDGSEVAVELTVTARRAHDGRTLFVGELVPTS